MAKQAWAVHRAGHPGGLPYPHAVPLPNYRASAVLVTSIKEDRGFFCPACLHCRDDHNLGSATRRRASQGCKPRTAANLRSDVTFPLRTAGFRVLTRPWLVAGVWALVRGRSFPRTSVFLGPPMEQSLSALANQALGVPSVHGDNMDHGGGHPPSYTMAATAMFENSVVQLPSIQHVEDCNGADCTGLTGVAHAPPDGWPWVEPGFVPPVLPVPEMEDGPQKMVHLPRLLANSGHSPELLESAVGTGMRLIHTLAGLLEPYRAIPDAWSSLRLLKALQARSTAPRTVVGVVGNTGAGKSSVINALLDEEEFVAPFPLCLRLRPLIGLRSGCFPRTASERVQLRLPRFRTTIPQTPPPATGLRSSSSPEKIG